MSTAQHVTFFPDYAAQTLSTAEMTLPELRTLVLKTTASEKAQLPWLKLAVFGDKRTDKNCLRSNDNVVTVTGIELDYDGKVMPFEEAIAIAEKARLHALLYTSANYKAEKPKWRIVLPTSCALPPSEREQLVARVNGLFGGIFADESFVLSQAFYYGSVNSNPDHRAEIVEGDFIDLRSDLDAGARGKGKKPKTNGHDIEAPWHIRNANAQGRGTSTNAHDVGGEPDETLIENIRSGGPYHSSLRDLAARHMGRGRTAEETITYLRGLMSESIGEHDDKRWKDRVASIPGLVDSAVEYVKRVKDEARNETPEVKADSFPVKPYVPRDPKLIPPREWLYHPHYVKQFASVTVAQSGVGKSSLMIAEALAMVSGKPLLNVQPEGKLRVWYWNGEDPPDELERRFAATMKHYGLTAEDIGDRLFFSSGDEVPMVIADGTKYGAIVAEPVVGKVVATIVENRLDVLWIDPFVSCHTVDENNNSGIDTVAKQWASIAKDTNCSIMLVHHARKIGAGGVVTADDARGASALNAAGRMTRTLNKMSEREGDDAEIDGQQRWRYFRIDDGKNNLAPPEVAVWCNLVSVPLGNDKYGWLGGGDNVGVVGPWTFPRAEKRQHGIVDILRVQEVIRKGGPWREHQLSKAEPWVGIPIAEALGYDLTRRPEKKAVVALVEGWLRLKLLKRIDGKDKRSEAHTYIEAGERPGVEVPRASGDA